MQRKSKGSGNLGTYPITLGQYYALVEKDALLEKLARFADKFLELKSYLIQS